MIPWHAKKGCCCQPCDQRPRANHINTSAKVPCTCVPRALCVYLLIGDCGQPYAVDPRGATYLRYDCKTESFVGSVTCGRTTIDVTVSYESDADGGEIYLTIESTAAGLIGDYKLRRLLTEYDQYCQLRGGPYEFEILIGEEPAVLEVSRPDYIENCEFTPRCGPGSYPYSCVCERACMTFDVVDETFGRRRGLDKACLREFYEYGELVCQGWEFTFLDASNKSVLYGLRVRVCIVSDEGEPLRFRIDPFAPDGVYVEVRSPHEVEPACVDNGDPNGNMNAEWIVAVDGREITLAISGDLHLEKYGCCGCWVRCFCVSWFSSTDAGSEIVCGTTVWDTPFGPVRLDCDCDGLPVLVFTPPDPYEDEVVMEVDCPHLTVRGSSFAEPSFAYKDTQITLSPQPCKTAECAGTAPCCGREIPRTLYLEIAIDPVDESICDYCDLHFVVPLTYAGQSAADPGTGLWKGYLKFTCDGRETFLEFIVRCFASGGCNLNLEQLDLNGSSACWFNLGAPGTAEPYVCVCDPLYAEWSWFMTATPCCTLDPEFPTIHGKMFLTE